jgi:hypothetical protein
LSCGGSSSDKQGRSFQNQQIVDGLPLHQRTNMQLPHLTILQFTNLQIVSCKPSVISQDAATDTSKHTRAHSNRSTFWLDFTQFGVT